VTESETKEIEPRVITFLKALYSHTTATVSPHAIVRSLTDDARNTGIEILTYTAFLSRKGCVVRTSKDDLEARYFVDQIEKLVA